MAAITLTNSVGVLYKCPTRKGRLPRPNHDHHGSVSMRKARKGSLSNRQSFLVPYLYGTLVVASVLILSSFTSTHTIIESCAIFSVVCFCLRYRQLGSVDDVRIERLATSKERLWPHSRKPIRLWRLWVSSAFHFSAIDCSRRLLVILNQS